MSNTVLSLYSKAQSALLALKPTVSRAIVLAVAAVVTGLLLLVFGDGLRTLEERLGALGWTLSADETIEQRITVVAIDEKSLEYESWPWSRETMARLVTAIDAAGAQLQLHDIVYPQSREGDDALIASLRAANSAVLAQVPVLDTRQGVRTGQMSHALSGLSCANGVPNTTSFVANHAGFSGIAKGHITPIVSSDGAVREVPALICVDGAAYPALAISAFLEASGSEQWRGELSEGQSMFAAEQNLSLASYPGLQIPLTAEGNLRISYQKSPASYRAVSAVDVINGNFDKSLIENGWVLVGATAFGIGDIVPTPYSGITPGVELQARLLGSLLDAQVPYTPKGANLFLIVIAGLFALALFFIACVRDRFSSLSLPLAGLALPVLALALHIQFLSASEVWLGWLMPAIYSIVAASALILLEHMRVRSERSRVFGNLHSYLPGDVAKEIAFNLPSSSVNAKRCEATLLSADLRNFSAFGEARPPEESAALLHYFFTKATEIVESKGGRIHEFKGDGLLAVWDGHDSVAAVKALAAAQSMIKAIGEDILPQDPPEGLEPLALGIGIEQGPVLIGSIGPAQRRTHTLLGDTVTITLRIQEMTAELAQPILLGECVARQLSDQKLESQGSYLLSGLRIPHTLFSPALSQAYRSERSDQPNLTVLKGGLK
ncbi:MAG: adenylate/guanylate cyclase domain-containing protein [Pseudohongiellaceae bacterium]|nr:adenylate/guanylate cyclase domain-containing protein [Pseudohongiellaceae bacterium]